MQFLRIPIFMFLVALLQSCMSLPLSRNNTNVTSSVSITDGPFEQFKRSEYKLMSNATGVSETRQVYILFFPLGRVKNDKELEQNAYFNAMAEAPNADAIILPRVKTSKVVIPLILVNYYSKRVTLTGRAVKLHSNVGEP